MHLKEKIHLLLKSILLTREDTLANTSQSTYLIFIYTDLFL